MYVSRLTFHTTPGKTHEVEQELQALVAMVRQITQVTEWEDFQKWSSHMSGLLTQSPKREVYLIVE